MAYVAQQLQRLITHRCELVHESTQRKNKLIALLNQLFPEFPQVMKKPNVTAALMIRAKYSITQAIVSASLKDLHECTALVGIPQSSENGASC
jgi:hypothetical protein